MNGLSSILRLPKVNKNFFSKQFITAIENNYKVLIIFTFYLNSNTQNFLLLTEFIC